MTQPLQEFILANGDTLKLSGDGSWHIEVDENKEVKDKMESKLERKRIEGIIINLYHNHKDKVCEHDKALREVIRSI